MGREKPIKEWELGLWASNVADISITDRARMVNWICDNWRAVKEAENGNGYQVKLKVLKKME